MSSTNYVDFSIRQNKSIERLIVFAGLRAALDRCALRHLVYVGFGSVWFTDFVLAHRELGIDTMFSLERDDIVFERAQFNKPYRTLKVLKGESTALIPTLVADPKLVTRPWIVWLDYDNGIDEDRLEELTYLALNLPGDSSLVTTFSARPSLYGQPVDRIPRLNTMFGSALQGSIQLGDVKDETVLMQILATAVQNHLLSRTLQAAREGGYIPAFELKYRDVTPMVTVGGFLPLPSHAERLVQLTNESEWLGRLDEAIVTPPLTTKEVAALQRQLPRARMLTRRQVQRMGFDLHDDQIQSFVTHYLRYPTFAQISR